MNTIINSAESIINSTRFTFGVYQFGIFLEIQIINSEGNFINSTYFHWNGYLSGDRIYLSGAIFYLFGKIF